MENRRAASHVDVVSQACGISGLWAGIRAPPRPLFGIHAARAPLPPLVSRWLGALVCAGGWASGAVGGRTGCCEPGGLSYERERAACSGLLGGTRAVLGAAPLALRLLRRSLEEEEGGVLPTTRPLSAWPSTAGGGAALDMKPASSLSALVAGGAPPKDAGGAANAAGGGAVATAAATSATAAAARDVSGISLGRLE